MPLADGCPFARHGAALLALAASRSAVADEVRRNGTCPVVLRGMYLLRCASEPPSCGLELTRMLGGGLSVVSGRRGRSEVSGVVRC